MKDIKANHRTPVILLGGAENTLSVVRDFGRKGIETHVIAGKNNPVFKSRYCTNRYLIPEDQSSQDYFYDLCFNKYREAWKGSVLFACCDDAIEFVIKHRQHLDAVYKLDIQKVALQKTLLDKKETLRLAKKAGLHVPEFWEVASLSEIDRIKKEAVFPLILKPVHSHIFQRTFKKKLLLINTAEELEEKARQVSELGLKYMISEYIPGPDTLLSSFYTYLDHNRNALFRYTKFVIRRFPVNFGGGSFHGAKWLPETAQEGERFFRHIDFTGLANIEFKKDLRDGNLKVIECNARFTAAQEFVTRCGINMPYIIYSYLTGNPLPKSNSYKEDLYFWYLQRDFNSFQELHQRGELSFLRWLGSFITKKRVYPLFRWDDPGPALRSVYDYIRMKLKLI